MVKLSWLTVILQNLRTWARGIGQPFPAYLVFVVPIILHGILHSGCADGLDSEAAEHLVLEINTFRISHGLKPLDYDPRLAEAAQAQIEFLLQMQPFCQCVDHEGEGGSSPADRVAAVGYPASCVGENLTSDADHPEDALNAWINSPSHRETMLGPEFVDVGVYIRGGLAAAVFACP